MRKVVGLMGLLIALSALACLREWTAEGTSNFLSLMNLRNLLTWAGLFGILSLGQAVVIITGGIDLSIGSVIALVSIATAMLMNGAGMNPVVVLPIALGVAAMIGVLHGVLVAKAGMQPFVVTLCGLFFYRGIARFITGDKSQGFGLAYPRLRDLGGGTVWSFVADRGENGLPVAPANIPERLLDTMAAPFIILVVLAALMAAYLHFSAQGRHVFALGANEDAARFSGIRTARVKIIAYVLCSLLSGIGGILLSFKVGSMGPSEFGNSYELYAIAGAVLGGCSLRGGSGNVPAVVIGASLIVLLKNLVTILGIPSQLEYVIIGGAILIGVCVDEFFTRRAVARMRTT